MWIQRFIDFCKTWEGFRRYLNYMQWQETVFSHSYNLRKNAFWDIFFKKVKPQKFDATYWAILDSFLSNFGLKLQVRIPFNRTVLVDCNFLFVFPFINLSEKWFLLTGFDCIMKNYIVLWNAPHPWTLNQMYELLMLQKTFLSKWFIAHD